jgi:hypothetical protein
MERVDLRWAKQYMLSSYGRGYFTYTKPKSKCFNIKTSLDLAADSLNLTDGSIGDIVLIEFKERKELARLKEKYESSI